MKKSLKYTIVIIIFLFYILGIVFLFNTLASFNPTIGTKYWEDAITVHELENSEDFEEIWSRSVYISYSGNDLKLVATNGKVYFLGSLSNYDLSSIYALDAWTSEVVWNTDPMPLATSFATDNVLFVSTNGGGAYIRRYDLATGEVLWNRTYFLSSGIGHLTVYNNKLYAYIYPDNRRVLNINDGHTLLSLFEKQPPLFNSNICGNNNLAHTPVYKKDTVYFSPGRETKIVCAVDLKTEEIKWISEVSILSNIVVANNKVFFLDENLVLNALDANTGEIIPEYRITFTSKPLTSQSANIELGNCYVAYDEENKIIFVYFGDSHQLKAILELDG